MSEKNESKNFIEEIIESDLASGKVKQIYTRFPPSPTAICMWDIPKVCA